MFKRKPKSDKAKKPKKEKKANKQKAAKVGPADGIVLQKPDTDVYTIMLIISFVAVLTACVLLWLELSTYGSYPWWKAS